MKHIPIKGFSLRHQHAFGMVMPERSFSNDKYRWGFNGKETDNEVKGTGNSLDFGARIYDSRLGRFLSLDPLSKQFPSESNYSYAGNSPILMIDEKGEQKTYYLTIITKTGSEIMVKMVDHKDTRIAAAKSFSETAGYVQIKDIEQHIIVDLSKGTTTIQREKVIGTYRMTAGKWLDNMLPELQGKGDVQNGGWTVTTSRQAIDPTKNTSKSYAPELNIDDMIFPTPEDHSIADKLEKLGDINRDVKVVSDIFANSFDAGAQISQTVEKAVDVFDLKSNNTRMKSVVCDHGCSGGKKDTIPANKASEHPMASDTIYE